MSDNSKEVIPKEGGNFQPDDLEKQAKKKRERNLNIERSSEHVSSEVGVEAE